jgi:queuosine precursor transporter
MLRPALVLGAAYLALAILANWLAAAYTVRVPFTDLLAPAGVFAIGGILVLRDWLQQLAGLLPTMALVYVAGLVSWAVAEAAGWTSLQRIALASVLAFTVSETAEALVFTPLRNRSLTLGVLASGIAGTALDSWLFLTIAFGSLAFFRGQFVGKGEMVLLGAALTATRRAVLPVATTS